MGWEECKHWRVCAKVCPLNKKDCLYYDDGTAPKATWRMDRLGKLYCSNCQKPTDNKTTYCPNCGRMMYGEDI